MDLTTATPTRTPAQGLARAVWVVAGICWIVTIGAVLLGGSVHGHHDVVLETSGLAWTVRLALFGSAWLVMVGAMMLPTAVPMLELFWTISSRHPQPLVSRAVFVATYLLVWVGFAFVALAGDAAVHALVDTWQWLSSRPALVLGGTLLSGGVVAAVRPTTRAPPGTPLPRGPPVLHLRHFLLPLSLGPLPLSAVLVPRPPRAACPPPRRRRP